MKKRIKVLVADDSVLMRLLISDILNEDDEIEVVETVSNGKEAFEKVKLLNPHVVILDMNMGEFDGLYAVKNIMKERPTPIVILSSIGNSDMTSIYEALELGAIGYLNKPDKSQTKIRDLDTQLIEKVKAAYNVEVKTPVIKDTPKNTFEHSFGENLNFDIIVIGSSTGGPPAVEKIITNLPENIPVPVLIAQHMPANFVPSFANRLNLLTNLNVSMADRNTSVKAGSILIMPGGKNSIIKKKDNGEVVVDFVDEIFKEFNYPSVNALMFSVAKIYGEKAIGVILTGMGKDGAEGMCAIKKAGGYTIIQNKETCVVYGMPGAVEQLNCVSQIVPINQIGGFLVSCL
jgi:two-component system, chemotaxis family, protein-glutamate methylesterase/glutaminase